MATQENSGLSIGEYLIRRLQDYGIRDVFGIPGDYILSFYTMLEQSPLRAIGCTREDCAGFAADAYARVNGMGALCVTLCVAGTELADPLTAFSEIDRVLATCARFKRPVYIEIPRDMVHVRPETRPPYQDLEQRSDTRALAEA